MPFSDLLVLDVGSYIAAPVATTILGDYGANVIKVEPPGTGDPNRALGKLPNLPQHDVNYLWHLDSRNKRSIALDLKSDDGHKVLEKLIERADVLVTNYPLKVRERLRLGYDDVAALNPKLIYASLTGYGERGPDADQAGFDSTAYFARSGLMHAARYQNQPPAVVMPAQGDRATGITLFAAITMALLERQRTGKGTCVATSLMANGLWANGVFAQAGLLGASLPPRPPRTQPRSALSNPYRSRDDRWFMLTVTEEDRGWPRLCRAIEQPELEHDARFAAIPERRANAAVLTEILDVTFASRDFSDWSRALKENNVAFGVIALPEELPDDVQAVSAGIVVDTDIAEMPQTIAAPFSIGSAEPRRAQPAPALGADTDEILHELGYQDIDIAALRDAGTVG